MFLCGCHDGATMIAIGGTNPERRTRVKNDRVTKFGKNARSNRSVRDRVRVWVRCRA